MNDRLGEQFRSGVSFSIQGHVLRIASIFFSSLIVIQHYISSGVHPTYLIFVYIIE